MALSPKDRTWIEGHFTKLTELITKNRIDIAILKTKAGIYGLLGGGLSILLMIAITKIFGK